MQLTGILRKIDELGRIILPIELRRTLNVEEKDNFEIFTDSDGNIILKKYNDVCVLCRCDEKDKLVQIERRYICVNCINKLVELKEKTL